MDTRQGFGALNPQNFNLTRVECSGVSSDPLKPYTFNTSMLHVTYGVYVERRPLLLGVTMLIDRRCLGLAELYEKLLKYCVLQDFVCMNWLVL